MKVEAFGCKLLLSNILDHDPKGGSTVNLKVKFLSPALILYAWMAFLTLSQN